MHRFKNWQLFAICVLTWGTTWFAITFQIGHVAPEVGVAMRFALAGAVILGLCGLRQERLRFTPTQHAIFALQGGFMYGVSYVCVYHAELHLVSGLVAVGYSASPLVAGIGARALFGVNLSPRFIVGGLLGIAGVALIFWPEFANTTGDRNTLLGVVFTVGSVLLSTVGSLTASRNRCARTAVLAGTRVRHALRGSGRRVAGVVAGPELRAARDLRPGGSPCSTSPWPDPC